MLEIVINQSPLPNTIHKVSSGRSHDRARGFTLVELLVVIGIIALLISILLPSLNKAKESARRVKCMSNIRQIAVAIVSYASANKGSLPGVQAHKNVKSYPGDPAPGAWEPNPCEWLRWEMNTLGSNPRLSTGGTIDKLIATQGIGPYLNLKPTNLSVLRCPSDSTYENRQVRWDNFGDFSFSYTYNAAFSFEADQFMPRIVSFARKITQIKGSSEKIVVYEEDERSVDDGFGRLWDEPFAMYTNNRLALRHDSVYHKKVDPAVGTVTYLPNSDGKGVVGFADGHADFVPRRYAHSPAHAIADPTKATTTPFIYK